MRAKLTDVAAVALLLAAADGQGAGYDTPPHFNREHWKRKRWSKGCSGGGHAPAVRMSIPSRRKKPAPKERS